ncbi:hypothetical protein [Nocardia mexicana]|uniref:Uncharacterized protein n=1 Tax=Nocardia mexicana TaxID=279262 RepID=A0A370HC54_9NOCA|nr:hypothetical protein [Nocardia mexicana]RDI54526.1 hypothetical protein DFR68_102654 [Nocardia mexicana]
MEQSAGRAAKRTEKAAGRAAKKTLTGAEHAVKDVGHVAKDVERTAFGAEHLAERLDSMSWKTASIILGVLLVLAIFIFRSCDFSPPSFDGFADAGTGMSGGDPKSLPESLRTASTCRSGGAPQAADTCVIEANSPLLTGGITGGRALSLTVQSEPAVRIADTITRWRSAGTTSLADTPVFVGVGPSSTMLYADRRSGLRIETGAFTDRTAVRTFAQRAGLVH